MGEAIIFFIVGIVLLLASFAMKYAEPPSEDDLNKLIPKGENYPSKTSLGCMVGFGTLLLRFGAVICFVNALLVLFSS
jgi:hypothetical protein